MRREGRQRGMVRTFNVLPEPLNPRPTTRILNKLESQPAAGLFERVSKKPTNHSKFTGKCDRPRCSGCHLHPITKAKNKSKGAMKFRSFNDKLDCKTICWTVMADRDGSDKNLVSGSSASRILRDLGYNYDHEIDRDGDDDEDDSLGLLGGLEHNSKFVLFGHGDGVVNDEEIGVVFSSSGVQGVNKVGLLIHDELNDEKVVVNDDDDDDDDDDIIVHGGVTVDDDNGYDGFFDISVVWNAVDDDGWAIVGGM